jgi:hypothetical protein
MWTGLHNFCIVSVSRSDAKTILMEIIRGMHQRMEAEDSIRMHVGADGPAGREGES